VLAAVDLSLASNDVLRGAVGLAADETVHLTVMHTVEGAEAADAVPSLVPWMLPEYRTRILEDARRAVEGVVSAVPADVDIRVLVLTGSAAPAILRHAADVDADLVVVGKSRGFKMFGSTTLRVLRKNARALLVIPSADYRAARVERQRAA
jgi:nucleotide-binding universal stress UspA family protein